MIETGYRARKKGSPLPLHISRGNQSDASDPPALVYDARIRRLPIGSLWVCNEELTGMRKTWKEMLGW